MSTEEKSHKSQIIIAVLGLTGVLGSALFANWDKVFSVGIKKETIINNVEKTALPKTVEPLISLPASFDCRKAETKIEKIICDTPKISHVDGQLGILYKTLRNKMALVNFETLKVEQVQWIKNRDKRILSYCQSLEGINVNCVTNIYMQRINEFKTILSRL